MHTPGIHLRAPMVCVCAAATVAGAIAVAPAQAVDSNTESGRVETSYSFFNPAEGSNPALVTRWNSCIGIRWAIDAQGLKRGKIKIKNEVRRLRSVFQEAAGASGYTFTYQGRVDGRAGFDGSDPTFPQISSTAWTARGGVDIVFTFAKRANAGSYTYPAFRSGAWGYGSQAGTPTAIPGSAELGKRAMVGSVIVNIDAIRQSTRTKRTGQIRNLYLHELGHALGLGHVYDPAQIMYPSVRNTVTHYANGDRAGLHALSSAPCF